jgi:hypothetical protein
MSRSYFINFLYAPKRKKRIQFPPLFLTFNLDERGPGDIQMGLRGWAAERVVVFSYETEFPALQKDTKKYILCLTKAAKNIKLRGFKMGTGDHKNTLWVQLVKRGELAGKKDNPVALQKINPINFDSVKRLQTESSTQTAMAAEQGKAVKKRFCLLRKKFMSLKKTKAWNISKLPRLPCHYFP